MRPTRVLLIDMAPITREIIRDTVSGAPDIALVGDFPADAPLVQVADDLKANVVIFGRRTRDSPLATWSS